MIDELLRFRVLLQLKSVERLLPVGVRKESSAEHSWSCLLLADFFLSILDLPLDRLKVYELLMYHDVIEIESGDSPLHPDKSYLRYRSKKDEREEKAIGVLRERLPRSLQEKFVTLFSEFEARETPEARFAKAIDALEPILHGLDYKDDWKGWSVAFLREKKLPLFEGIPGLQDAFLELLDFLQVHGYLDR